MISVSGKARWKEILVQKKILGRWNNFVKAKHIVLRLQGLSIDPAKKKEGLQLEYVSN